VTHRCGESRPAAFPLESFTQIMNVAVEASLKSASTVFTVEVVISRFRENILHCLELICKEGTFDEEIDVKVTIYNKGGDDCAEILQSAVDKKKGKFDRIVQLLRDPNKFRIISLDNLGREAHTYLFHVVHNYNDMASVTVFLPATCMNQVKEDHTVKLLQRVNTTRNTVIAGQWMAPSIRNRLGSFIISKWSGRDSDNAKLLTESNAVDCMPATRRPFSAWYDHFSPVSRRMLPLITPCWLYTVTSHGRKKLVTTNNFWMS